jgi:hypothetical protein
MEAAHTHRPHVACPVCGKKAKFRLPLKGKTGNWEETGTAICACRGWRDGFAVLQSVNGWSFGKAVSEVAKVVGLENGTASPIDTSCAKAWVGVVTDAKEFTFERNGGDKFQTWGLWLRDEVNKENGEAVVQRFLGNGIRRAWEQGQAQIGDRVEVKLLGTRDVGKKSPLKVYSVRKLPSQAEMEAQAKADADKAAECRKMMIAVWKQAQRIDPASNSPEVKAVVAYLKNRGFPVEQMAEDGWFDHLRAGRGKAGDSWFPCLISAIRDLRGMPITLHRTFLTDDGKKAGIENPKRLMAIGPEQTIAGCAIRLGVPTEGVLCVAEGLETSLSVVAGTGYPCWATVNAPCMPSVAIPDSVHTVLIFEDKDANQVGAKAAEQLRQRLCQEGKVCIRMQIPDPIPEGSHGIDWNDIWLMPDGAQRFPVKRPAISAE